MQDMNDEATMLALKISVVKKMALLGTRFCLSHIPLIQPDLNNGTMSKPIESIIVPSLRFALSTDLVSVATRKKLHVLKIP